MADNDYDAFAAAYDAENEINAWNALYERPAILKLAGEVSGLRVLDAGCGGGSHAAELVSRGARVTGFDSSAAMLAIARKRLGPDVALVEADLSRPLPFADGGFDLVLSALALHYIEDWSQPLGEFARVLRPSGRLVFSTHHPFMDHGLAGGANYFATYEFADSWMRGGREMSMRFWHRPLSAMTAALVAAGFAIEAIEEPQPLPEAAVRDPGAYEKLTTAPRFLFFAARKQLAGD